MAVTISGGAQRYNNMFQMVGTATAYSESVTGSTATTANPLNVNYPVSIVSVPGTTTATGVASANVTLGTAPYEGFTKYIITSQGAATASDSLGNLIVELASPVGSTASTLNNVVMEYPACLECKWVNNRWVVFGALNQNLAPTMSTATIR